MEPELELLELDRLREVLPELLEPELLREEPPE